MSERDTLQAALDERYQLGEVLGRGGMGTVYSAVDHKHGRAVAIKVLHAELGSAVGRSRFLREIETAARLNHPHILPLHDSGSAGPWIYFVMPRVEGESLSERLERMGPLPANEALRIAQEVADALAYAHAHGVLHRDIKPANILLHGEHALVADFGIAQLLTGPEGPNPAALTQTGLLLGTPQYMSPEHVNGRALDGRSDVYSLGCVLFEMLTGRPPFVGDAASVLARQLSVDPERLDDLLPQAPGALATVLARALAKNPADRYADAGEFRTALEASRAALASGGTLPGGRLRRGGRKLARRKLGTAQVAVLVTALVVLAAGATFIVRQRLDRRELVLAVMPFRNTSADREDTGYIGEALGSELTARLGRMGGFRVLPWETTARFADSKRTLPELAHDLGADLLLVGHYDENGERIDVGLELVEGRRGHQRWSDRLQGATRDLALMQNDLAGRIARQLAPAGRRNAKSGAPVRVVQNPEAYEAYLRGVNALHASALADRALAEPMFRYALDLDSTFADAWVGLGAVLVERYYQGGRGGLADLEQGQRCFQHALALDPVSGPAIRGLVRVLGESEGTSKQALALADSAGPRVADEVERHLIRGSACTLNNLPEEAADAFERVLALDPHNQAARFMNSFTLWWAGRPQDAVESSKAYVREFGEDPDIYAYSGAALAAMGRYKEARVFLQRSVSLFSGSSGAFAVLYCAGVLRSSGERAAAEALLDDKIPAFEAGLAAAPDNLRLRTDLANLYAARGDMARFEVQWAILQRELAAGTLGSGGEYGYTPFVLAQRGELERAKQVLVAFPPGFGQIASVLPASVGLENIFRGGRSTEFASSPEVFQLRASIQSMRATLRRQYPWLAGVTGGPLIDRGQRAPGGV